MTVIKTDKALTVVIDGQSHTVARTHPLWTQINAALGNEENLRVLLNPRWGLPEDLDLPLPQLRRLAQFRVAGLLDVALKVIENGETLHADAPITPDGHQLYLVIDRDDNIHVMKGSTLLAKFPQEELANFFPPGCLVWDPPQGLEIEVGQTWVTRAGDPVVITAVTDDAIEGEHDLYGISFYTRDGRFYPDRAESEDDLMEFHHA